MNCAPINTDERGLVPVQPAGGSGGGKGGGSGSGAHEANDTLRSKADARVIDLLSEGEIEGIVGLPQLQGVFASGTPIQNADGTFNFKDASFYFNPGTQDQSYFQSFASAENEVGVGVQVKTATPWVQTISTPVTNAVRVTVQLPALSKQDKTNGDIKGTSIQYKLQLQTQGAGFVDVLTEYITGKCSNVYQRSYRIELSGTGPWDVRMVRVTADSTSSFLRNDTYVFSYAVIIDGKFRYPNSAIAAMVIDSEQFPTIPTRAYDTKGIKVRVPSNYDPISRVYSGIWDGTFKVAYSNNPAWCWYDLMLSPRYGLGNLLKSADIDKWSLYTIGQYCDGLVPNGNAKRAVATTGVMAATITVATVGTSTFPTMKIARASGSFLANGFQVGDQVRTLPAAQFINANNNQPMVIRTIGTAGDFITVGGDFEPGKFYDVNANLVPEARSVQMQTIIPVEPRFTCNLYLQTQEEALKVAAEMAGTFRGMVYYGAGLITPVQDSPGSPIATFNKANVEGGKFIFQGTAGRARHTSALIGWNDRTDLGRKKYAYVEDSDAVLNFGVNQLQADAFGCASYGQAYRYGRWALLTEQSRVGITPETVSFTVGLEGMVVVPGSIIQLSLPWRAGKSMAGRVVSDLSKLVDLTVPLTDEAGVPLTWDMPNMAFAGGAFTAGLPLTTES